MNLKDELTFNKLIYNNIFKFNTKEEFTNSYKIANEVNKGKHYLEQRFDGLNLSYHDFKAVLQGKSSFKIGGILLDVITGKIESKINDLNILCLTGNLSLERYYNSNRQNELVSGIGNQKVRSNGLFGIGWALAYESYCVQKGDILSIVFADGTSCSFKKSGENWLNINSPSFISFHSENAQKKLITIKKNGLFYTYEINGRLKNIEDKNGNNFELIYLGDTNLIDKINSSCSSSLKFSYKNNKISQITDNIGRTTSYSYDGDYLKCVTQASGGKYFYFYDKKHNILCEIINPLENTQFKAEFNRYRKPIKLYKTNNENLVIKYDESLKNTKLYIENLQSNTNDIERAENLYLTYKYNRENIVTEVFDCQNKNILYKKPSKTPENFILEKDKRGNVIEIKEQIYKANNTIVNYEYDAKGRIISFIDAKKQATSYTYKSENSVLPEITTFPNDHKIYREFDGVGRLIKQTEFGHEKSFKYNDLDHLVETIFEDGSRDFRRYDYLGNLKELITPQSIEKVKGEKGVSKSFRFFHDDNNVLTKIVTPNNKTIIVGELKGNNLRSWLSNNEQYESECALKSLLQNPQSMISKTEVLEFATNILTENIEKDYVGNILELAYIDEKCFIKDNRNNVEMKINTTSENKKIYKKQYFSYDKNLNLIQNKLGIERVAIDEKPTTFNILNLNYDDRNNLCHKHSGTRSDEKMFYKGVNQLSKKTIKVNEFKNYTIVFEYNNRGFLMSKIELVDLIDIENALENIEEFKMLDKELELIKSNLAILKNEVSTFKLVTEYYYDLNGNLIKMVLPNNEELKFDYNDDCEPIFTNENEFVNIKPNSENSLNNSLTYGLNDNENMEKTFKYDKFGRVIKIIYNGDEENFELIEYDFANNISKYVQRDGTINSYFYNSLNKLSKHEIQVDTN